MTLLNCIWIRGEFVDTHNRQTVLYELGGIEDEDEDKERDIDEVEDDRDEDVGSCSGCSPFGVNFCNDR